MNNLLRFIIRYYLFLLFVLLEAFCFYLIYRNSKYQQAAYVNMANSVNGKVFETWRNGVDYFYLRQYSDSLMAENAALRAQLRESQYDTRIDSGKVSDSTKRYIQNYTYIAAHVIKNSITRSSNIIYLDRGRLQGLKKQMGVIAADGVVGQIISVTDNYAAVQSVLSKESKVGVKFKKNDYFGTLHWDGGNSTTATLLEIPPHVPIQEGDTVVTSGYSQLFPRNIMVGVIKKIKSDPNKGFKEVTVNLSTDFGNLKYVYVVDNLRRNEIQVLDSITAPGKND